MALKGYVHNYVTYSNPNAVPHYLINSSNRVSSNGTWMKEGEYSFRGGGGLDNLSNVYQVFNCNWNNYCNKFNNGAYVDICLPSAIKLSGFNLSSSSTSCFPSSGEIQYSDDGKTYVYCASWHNTSKVKIPSNVDAHRIWRIQSSSSSSLKILDNKVINFDGSKDYASVPVALTDKNNWSIEIELATKETRSNSRIYRQPCILGVDTPGAVSRDFHIDVKNGNLHLFSGLGGTNSTSQLNCGTLSIDTHDYGWDTGIKINDGALHKINLTCKDNKLTLILDDNELGYLNIDRTVNGNVLYLGASYPSERCFCQFDLYKLYVSVDGNAGRYYKPSDMQILSSSNMNIAKVQLYYNESIDYTLPEGLGGWVRNNYVTYQSHGPLVSKQIIPYFTYKKYRETRKIQVRPKMSANGTWMSEDAYTAQGGGGLDGLSNVYRVFNGGWTSYCNKFNEGAWIEISLTEPIAIREIYLSSSGGSLPARGEIYYSDDGETYTKCTDWIDTSNSKECTSSFDDVGAHKIWKIKSNSSVPSEADFTTEEGIRFDGNKTYGKYNISLTDQTNWSINLSIKTNETRSSSNVWSHPCILGVDSNGYKSRDFHIDVKNGNLHLFSGLGGTNDASQLNSGSLIKTNGDYGWDTGIYISDGNLHNIILEFRDNKLHLSLDNNYLGYLNTTLTVNSDIIYVGSSYPSTKSYCAYTLNNLVIKVNDKLESPTLIKCSTFSNRNISQALLYYYEEVVIDPWEGMDRPMITGWVNPYTTYQSHGPLVSKQIIPYFIYSKTSELRISWTKPYQSIDNGIWWEDGKWSFRTSDGVKQPENLYKVFQGWHSGDKNCIYGNNVDEWFEVCLPKPLKVVSIYLQSYNGYLPRGVKIAYSDDGINYTDIATWTNTSSNNSEGKVNIPNPEKHRIWRIITTVNTNPSNIDANISKAILYHEELVKINPWEGRDVFIAGSTVVYATARSNARILDGHVIIPYLTLRKHDVLDDMKSIKIKCINCILSLDEIKYLGKVNSSRIKSILRPDITTD